MIFHPHALWYWILLGTLVLAGAYLRWCFVKRLRNEHPTAWTSLGKPSSGRDLVPSRPSRADMYLWEGAYRQLRDAHLNRLVVLMTALGIVAIILVLLGVFHFIE